MTVLAPYPDAELVMMDLLKPVAAPGTTVTHTDENLVPPYILVQRIGGPDDGVTDHAIIQISTFGSTRPQAWSLYRDVQQVILAACGTAVSGDFVTDVLIDYTETISSGKQIPYPNPDIRFIVAEYRVDLRRPF